ncbi:MAG TPA: hypothetical protein PK156_33055 [Polyangium sp.]|nr:hypothetical protein [Polyangium sp.]
MFISRRDAVKKYAISYTRLQQLEKKGKLTPIDVSTVGNQYERTTNKNLKVVYEEAQVAALKRNLAVDVAFVRQKRRDARVFDMITEGFDVPDIVMRTRLELAAVKHLRDEYIREKDGFVVPGELRRIAREHGINIGPHNIVETFVRLLEYGRGIKPPKERMARIKITPEE